MLIPRDVFPDLLAPKLFPTLWPTKQVAIVTVPEASMDEENGIAAGEHEVRLAWKVPVMQPKTESAPVQRGPDRQLRFGVLSLDTGHHPASGCG